MRRRPFALTAIACVLIGCAFSMPLQVMLLYGHSLAEFSAIAAKLTILNLASAILMLLAAMSLWRATRAALYFAPLSILITAINNFNVGYWATDYNMVTTSLASFMFAFLHLPLLHPKIMELLQTPSLRWWLSAPRLRRSVPVLIEGSRLSSLKAETFDLSETGIFVPISRELGVGDWIHVRLNFDTLAQVRCQGRVVRRNEARGNYPAGVGIQFVDMSRKQKRELKRYIERDIQV